MKPTVTEKTFRFFLNLFMIGVALIHLLPVLNILGRSLSSISAVAGGQVLFWPKNLNWHGWTYIVGRTNYLNALWNSVIITTLGTVIALLVTVFSAYSLSHSGLRGRKAFIAIYVGIMIFHAGILPNYFQMKAYGLLNTLWVLILPGVVNPYYMFVLIKNMESIPDSLEEAARIDGASYRKILLFIIIPVSKAGIATIAVFFSVNYWNKYFNALLYITKNNLKPITLYLYELIKSYGIQDGLGEVELLSFISVEIIHASAVMLTVLPILLIYPFMQKYFVKGTMAGAVKG
jgi:putative aldouronate transport system permease protein